jgi:hypothetical protein
MADVDFILEEVRPEFRSSRWMVVCAEDNSTMGEVRFRPQQGRYVFYPRAHIVLNSSCLIELTEFLDQQTAAQKSRV